MPGNSLVAHQYLLVHLGCLSTSLFVAHYSVSKLDIKNIYGPESFKSVSHVAVFLKALNKLFSHIQVYLMSTMGPFEQIAWIIDTTTHTTWINCNILLFKWRFISSLLLFPYPRVITYQSNAWKILQTICPSGGCRKQIPGRALGGPSALEFHHNDRLMKALS